jgi:site-specific DNA-methyltransferase (adenine-specific)
MRVIPISAVVVAPGRQRQEFDPKALMELQESILKFGLMHPLVVRDGEQLVAGERRLRAVQDIYALGGQFSCNNQPIPAGHVPVVSLGDLSPLDAMEAELDENIKRKDLTWQETAQAIAKLHEFRVAQAAATGGVHKVADTAMEIEGRADGDYQEKTRQAIIVARHLDNPDVAKAKDTKEAFKILKRAEEAKVNAAIGAAVGKTFSSADHTLLLGDCIDWMQSIPPASFDVICTDPPYGMGADTFGDGAGRLTAITHSYADDEMSFRGLLAQVAEGIDRVAKPAAHLYLCCDIDQFHWLRELFANIGGWHVFRTPLINVKAGGGRVPLPEHGPRRCYETILYAFRGDKRTRAIYPDIISSAADDNLGHGAQKPVELYTDLLRRSIVAGDSVLDPFAGTGTIFPAAHGLKVRATGIELNPSYHGICVKRIEELK